MLILRVLRRPVGLHVLTPELLEKVKEKSEPRVLRVSTAIYQQYARRTPGAK